MPAPVRTTSIGAFACGAPAEASARFCPWCYRDGDRVCSVQAHWPEVRPHNPLYLSGVECVATRAMEAAGPASPSPPSRTPKASTTSVNPLLAEKGGG